MILATEHENQMLASYSNTCKISTRKKRTIMILLLCPNWMLTQKKVPYFSDEDKQRGHGIEDNQVATMIPVVSIESKSGNRIEQNNDKVATNRLPVKHHDSAAT